METMVTHTERAKAYMKSGSEGGYGRTLIGTTGSMSDTAQLHVKGDDEIQTVTSKFPDDEGKLIHFGFALDDEIAKKYFAYRDKGQHGWSLDRLVTEDENLKLVKVEEEWYPEWYLGDKSIDNTMPSSIFSPEEMSKYGSYDEWKNGK